MLTHEKRKDIQQKLSIKEKLILLRKKMREFKIDAFLVPHNDMYFNEITAPYYNRLEWITGFTGSAGFAIIFERSAVIFTDGRYSIQIQKEINHAYFKIEDIIKNSPFYWLKENIKKNITLGFDPWLHSIKEVETQGLALKKFIEFKEVDNLIDQVWSVKPFENLAKPFLRPSKLSGNSAEQKIKQIREKLKLNQGEGFILTCPDSICWLTNIRGHDVPNSPLMNGYAIVHHDSVCIYSTKETYIDNPINLRENVALKYFNDFFSDVRKLTKVLFEPTTTPFILKNIFSLPGIKSEQVINPISLLNAIKNPTELKGAIRSHEKDGIALLRFVKWFKSTKITQLDEVSLVTQLEKIRKLEPTFYYNSFDTISATGSNGAIIHYRVSLKSNKKIASSNLTLVDSGGQYLEGTTDLTRTLIKGRALTEHKFFYTKVLQGLIFLSKLSWPEGLTGRELDPLARYFLWEYNLDYQHGTGHGVGVFSNVHQGPQGITRLNEIPLKPGMILSIEPGIYLEGKLGIRLENLVYVKKNKKKPWQKREFLKFETLTLVPFERNLIEKKLLSKDELRWLNFYHHNVYQKLGPHLPSKEKIWLSSACKKI
ncbi:MAG: X-Pro aminopeptidase [Rhodobacteraceae bacterium]|nr:X-Pro aminopeptidase [Paracoccaceae bacterium]